MDTPTISPARHIGQFLAAPIVVVALSIGGSFLFGIPFGIINLFTGNHPVPLSTEVEFLLGFQTGAALGGIAGALKGFVITSKWALAARIAAGATALAITVLAVLHLFGVR